MNRAWKYCRQAGTDEMLSVLAVQNRLLEYYAAAHEFSVVGEIKVVETGTPADRESIRELLNEAAHGTYDVLLISGLDRLSRNVWDALTIVSKLFACGDRVLDASTNEEISADALDQLSLASASIVENLPF